jgi:hypothetical protein
MKNKIIIICNILMLIATTTLSQPNWIPAGLKAITNDPTTKFIFTGRDSCYHVIQLCLNCRIEDTTDQWGCASNPAYQAALMVNGDIAFKNTGYPYYFGNNPGIGVDRRSIMGNSYYDGLGLYSEGDFLAGSGIELHSADGTQHEGSIYFAWNNDPVIYSHYGTNNQGFAFNWGHVTNPSPGVVNWVSQMVFNKNAYLGILDSLPVDRLTVNGDISFTANTTTARKINGRTTSGGLSIFSNTSSSNGSSIFMKDNGKIGISDASPVERLTVDGNLAFTSGATANRKIVGQASSYGLDIFANTSTSDGASVTLNDNSSSSDKGAVKLNTNGSSVLLNSNSITSSSDKGSIKFNTNGAGTTGFDFWNTNSSASMMRLLSNGNVGINETSPTEILTINGNMAFSPSSSTDRNIYGQSSNNGLNLYGATDATDGGAIQLFGNGSANGSAIGFNTANSGSVMGFDFYNTNTSTSLMRINADGKIGINDISPYEKLTIDGNISFTAQASGLGRRKICGRTNNHLALYGADDSTNGAGILIDGWGGNCSGGIKFYSSINTDNPQPMPEDCSLYSESAFEFVTNDWATSGGGLGIDQTRMRIMKDGKVVIGSSLCSLAHSSICYGPYPNPYLPTTRAPYKLYVEGGILAQNAVNVGLTLGVAPGWSDFVFDDNYQLKSLSEVDQFIKQNKHLPEIPTTEDVTRDGIELVTMTSKLLQKIEELTIYAIQQQKEIDELKKAINH